jgi:exonuclease-1
MAYLCANNMADFVVTEDSDLIVFGVEKVSSHCIRILRMFKQIIFKLTTTGVGTLYRRSRLDRCVPSTLIDAATSTIDFVRFRRICILSGCDYLPLGLPGVGLGKATKFFASHSNSDADLEKVSVRAYRFHSHDRTDLASRAVLSQSVCTCQR